MDIFWSYVRLALRVAAMSFRTNPLRHASRSKAASQAS